MSELTQARNCAILPFGDIMIKKNNACCFSGHRVIPSELLPTVSENLERIIKKLASDGICDFITGGALGFDALAADIIIKLRKNLPHIRLILALPCRSQSDKWRKADKQRYDEHCRLADDVRVLSEEYDSGCMMRRNRFMVDNSRCCVFFLSRTNSGTYKTVSYAMEKGLELYNVLSD